MKKLSFILVVLVCVCLSIPAYAVREVLGEEPEADIGSQNTLVLDTTSIFDDPDWYKVYGYETDPRIDNPDFILNEAVIVEAEQGTDGILADDYVAPRLADGAPGRGTIGNPAEYWAHSGYPDNVSFANESGGEILEDGTSVGWWEIGVVNADEAAKQEILDLVSPNCRVTFWNCTYSYAQREAAFNEIYASRNEIVLDVLMGRNTQVVFVAIAEGYEKEYARMYIEKYGSFIVVTNDVYAADDAIPIGGREGGMETGGKNDPFVIWFWPLCLVTLLSVATFVYLNRTRFVPAMQTNNGNIITRNTPISRKQTIMVIKNSAVKPSDDVFTSLLEKVEKAHSERD